MSKVLVVYCSMTGNTEMIRASGITEQIGEVDAELVRDDLRDLGVEPLAHLGAAVVDEHRAVAVDVDERVHVRRRV